MFTKNEDYFCIGCQVDRVIAAKGEFVFQTSLPVYFSSVSFKVFELEKIKNFVLKRPFSIKRRRRTESTGSGIRAS